MQDLIALLEECLAEGDDGQAVLFAWFLVSRKFIVSAIQEAKKQRGGARAKIKGGKELPERSNQKVLEELKGLQNEIKELGERGNQKLVKELNKVHKEIKELNKAAKEYRGALRKARKQIRNPSLSS